MAIHAPTVHPRPMPSVAGFGSFLLALVLLALLAVLVFWITARPIQPTFGGETWMTDHRAGEIDAGSRGAPHGNWLIYRDGEINASKIQTHVTFSTDYPGGFTSAYSPLTLTGPLWANQVPGGFTSTYNPLHLTTP
jgi:hypothetical protein